MTLCKFQLTGSQFGEDMFEKIEQVLHADSFFYWYFYSELSTLTMKDPPTYLPPLVNVAFGRFLIIIIHLEATQKLLSKKTQIFVENPEAFIISSHLCCLCQFCLYLLDSQHPIYANKLEQNRPWNFQRTEQLLTYLSIAIK